MLLRPKARIPMTQFSPSPYAAPPTVASQIPIAPSRWPVVFGVFAIVFGVLGSCTNVWGVVSMIFFESMARMTEQPQEFIDAVIVWRPHTIVFSLLAGALSITLLVGGIMLLRRRAASVGVLRTWSVARMLIVPGGAALAYVTQQAQFEAMRQQPEFANNPVMTDAFMQGMLIFAVVLTILWGWALPIVMLVWFSRAKIRSEVAAWS
jgi:hypothetical protein